MGKGKFLIVDCGSKKTPEIANILAELGYFFTIDTKEELLRTNTSAYSGIIISGAPILLTEVDPEQYLNIFRYLKKDDPAPTLGICFGHQIIGLHHGADIYRHEEIQGGRSVKILKNDPLLSGFNSEISFTQDHKESLVLSSQFSLLATSKESEVEAIRHRKKKLWGVQFHPEVSGEAGKKLIRNFCEMCKKM